jgi:PAS domain S-box-containing protein
VLVKPAGGGDLFGYRRDDLIGQSIEILLSERFRKQHASRLAAYMKNAQAEPTGADLDLWGLRKDGGEFPIEVSLSPLTPKDGSAPLISSIIRDVSRQRALSEQLRQTALLEERNRMARDVHDMLAQGLTGIVLQLETAEEEFKKDAPGSLRHIARARELARSTLEEARQSTQSLSPPTAGKKNLVDSIRGLVQRFGSETPIKMGFSLSGTPREVDGGVEENLTRVAQQAITNALQHSQATRIRVELKFSKNELKLRVTDNGKGFVPSAVSDGFGLRSMRERVKGLRGNFNLESKPGKGTQIDAQVPVSQPAEELV